MLVHSVTIRFVVPTHNRMFLDWCRCYCTHTHTMWWNVREIDWTCSASVVQCETIVIRSVSFCSIQYVRCPEGSCAFDAFHVLTLDTDTNYFEYQRMAFDAIRCSARLCIATNIVLLNVDCKDDQLAIIEVIYWIESGKMQQRKHIETRNSLHLLWIKIVNLWAWQQRHLWSCKWSADFMTLCMPKTSNLNGSANMWTHCQ